MAIPTPQDFALADIDNLTAGIMVRLTTMRHAGKGPRDIGGLREALQEFVDRVMAFAHETEPS